MYSLRVFSCDFSFLISVASIIIGFQHRDMHLEFPIKFKVQYHKNQILTQSLI